MPEFEVVGSFDGLLCLADALSNSTPYIYNPFTRDYIELLRTIQYPNQHKYVVFGFGYNPLTEVCKVVKITYCTNTTGFKDSRIHFWRSPQLSDVQICSTGRPIWRSIGSASHYLDPSPAQTLVNGRLHWATWNPLRERYGGQLVSFDLHDEKFRKTFSWFTQKSAGGYIWVMKEYGAKESWVKEWIIGSHIPQALEQKIDGNNNNQYWKISKIAEKAREAYIRVLNISESGHILLEYQGRALVLYDPTDGNFTELEFEGCQYGFKLLFSGKIQ
ncbi:hypothetical protein ACLB2K_067382 [Fragaria x ananassa]